MSDLLTGKEQYMTLTELLKERLNSSSDEKNDDILHKDKEQWRKNEEASSIKDKETLLFNTIGHTLAVKLINYIEFKDNSKFVLSIPNYRKITVIRYAGPFHEMANKYKVEGRFCKFCRHEDALNAAYPAKIRLNWLKLPWIILLMIVIFFNLFLLYKTSPAFVGLVHSVKHIINVICNKEIA